MTSEKSTYNIKDVHVFDIEVYPNWAYVLFQEPNGTFVSFEFKENYPALTNELSQYISVKTLIGFHSNYYDDHILQHLISGTSTPGSTYELSKHLIESDKYRKPATVKSIDLMGSTGQVSLKLLAVRMGWPKLEELPFDPTKPVDATAISHLKDYCKNDVLITAELYKRMAGALKNRQCLSEKYGVDLLSATEPNIAETVITSEYEKQTGLNKYSLKKLAKKPTTVTLTCPEWFDNITDPALKGFVDRVKSVEVPVKDSGHSDTSELNAVISIGDRSYKVGGGGIHSIDGPGCYRSNDTDTIVEIDVTSYYPAIIIQNNLWARHTRPEILSEIYAGIVNARIAAKRAGDKLTADSYKIVINSYFGKHSNIYSALYDPAIGASVTVIGQIGLLWLILNLEAAGYRILSGNTDGIVVKIPTAERNKVEAIVSEWEQATGFDERNHNK